MHLVWHRTELRTHDHPALDAAARSGETVLPLVIIDPIIFGRPTTTPRRQAWFLENVRALRESYRALGSDLIVREGVPHEVLGRLAGEAKLTHAHYIRNHTPYARERDEAADRVLREAGVEVHAHPGQYTHPPGEVRTNSGGRYTVFGPYGRKWLSLPKPKLAPTPSDLPPVPRQIARGTIPDVASDIPLPEAGERAALARLESFLRHGEEGYPVARDFPARRPSTSHLSMYFNIGALGPRVAVHRSHDSKWRSELAWWDFNAEALDHHPEGATLEFKEPWRGFPWRDDPAEARRWEEGMTGFPMVDAGMRQLRATGFMHNRARLVTASFLTKHLLIDWRVGEAIFRGLLLCGDSAQNIGNWQWVAGCGYDASPYFRVLNPVSQGEKFDPKGDYVREWVPELAGLPGKSIHRPWKAAKPPAGYPAPMIDLDFGRERFLEAARAFLRRPRKDAGG
ncbi:cryptochrome/photolyase family protein [Tundrisphaera sp. TA3]|uniref:cryptochrome/photolyase family protein n=1 Tax=Tundrisphaera sp. TA3 TaxID=3435775 RepID=UPI003EB93C74